MKIVMAQMEIVSGDIIGNRHKAAVIVIQHRATADFIVFPELASSGYNCGQRFEQEEFIDDNLETADYIRSLTAGYPNCAVIFGCPTYDNQKREHGSKALRLHNSALIFCDGKQVGAYDKILLANDYQHEDRKYFIPGNSLFVGEHAGIKFGILICEDVWYTDHNRNLPAELKSFDSDMNVLFSLNFSYFAYTKPYWTRPNLVQSIASRNNVTVFYVAAVGIGDIVKNIMVYDGGSLIACPNKSTYILPLFDAETAVVYYDAENQCLESTSDYSSRIRYMHASKSNDLKYELLWKAMLYTQKTLFDQIGIKTAQVHLSGGLDSALVAVLCAKAMGSENCLFVTNPSMSNGDVTKNSAQYSADKLGVKLYWLPVQQYVDPIELDLRDKFMTGWVTPELPNGEIVSDKQWNFVVGTAQALSRTYVGLTLANLMHTGVVCTGNHTENVLGWFTFHDIGSVGIHQPLGDLTKVELYYLARYINQLYGEELVPRSLFAGNAKDDSDPVPRGLYGEGVKPAAELADANNDPFDYLIYSGVCADLIRDRLTPREMMERFDNRQLDVDYYPDQEYIYHRRKEFSAAVADTFSRAKRSVGKGAQSAPADLYSRRGRGFASRETIIDKWNGHAE